MKKFYVALCIILTMCCMSACGSNEEKVSEPAENKQEEVSAEPEINQEKVDELINMINEIGTVSLESKEKIDSAKDAYYSLTVEEKALVTNYSVLEAAEKQYDEVLAVEKDRLKNMYQANFDADHDKVENLTWYMHKNMPDYIDTRSYLIPYIGVQNGSAWICVRYNYTEDDWIFWEDLTIVVDGEKFMKSVGYFNTVRDNSGGVVWEYYDDILNINESLDSSEIQMLQKIANSSETIVRFSGDDYHYDLVVSDKDKTMIKDVLNLYSAYVAN